MDPRLFELFPALARLEPPARGLIDSSGLTAERRGGMAAAAGGR